MKLTILGSGTNLHPRRAAAGYLVETDQTLILDFGPRALANLLKSGTDRHAIQYLLFSHFHADHFSDFITFYFDAVIHTKLVGPRPDLTIIGPKGSKRLFGTIIKTFPSFNEATFKVDVWEVGDRAFELGKTRIQPRTVEHSAQLHCIGYRVEHDGRAVAYSGDARYCPSLIPLCEEVDLAILDCSYPANRPGPAHMHAGECGRVAAGAKAKRLVLSHLYPVAERFDIERQARRAFAGRITVGRDLLKVQL